MYDIHTIDTHGARLSHGRYSVFPVEVEQQHGHPNMDKPFLAIIALRILGNRKLNDSSASIDLHTSTIPPPQPVNRPPILTTCHTRLHDNADMN